MNKIFLITLICLVYFFVMTWIFNHINPWLSIILSIGGVILLINYLTKQIKNKLK